jgi:hypothetical protein
MCDFGRCRVSCAQPAGYELAMKTPVSNESRGKLIRLRANRRGAVVDLRVHYEISRENGCDTFRIISVDETQ